MVSPLKTGMLEACAVYGVAAELDHDGVRHGWPQDGDGVAGAGSHAASGLSASSRRRAADIGNQHGSLDLAHHVDDVVRRLGDLDVDLRIFVHAAVDQMPWRCAASACSTVRSRTVRMPISGSWMVPSAATRTVGV